MIGVCLNCNISFNYRNSFGKYCTNFCQKTYENNLRYERWLNGENDVWSTPSSYKRAVIRCHGYKCSECGIDKWNNKIIGLELEHKDGDFRNNIFDNLCLLCPNCHSQTSTFKAKNKGKGRDYRRKQPVKHCGDAIAL